MTTCPITAADIADFGSRSDALDVNLNGLADDGAPGEHDNVGPTNDVEGGRRKRERHPDRGDLHERPETNVLNGGAGGDTFHTVDSGADTIDGGDDADEACVDDLIDPTTNVETVHSTTQLAETPAPFGVYGASFSFRAAHVGNFPREPPRDPEGAFR